VDEKVSGESVCHGNNLFKIKMKKKIITLSLLVAVSTLFVAAAALAGYGSSNEKKSKLSGYVKEYKTLRPLSGASVKLYNKSGALKDKDKTNKKGKYKFSDLNKGTFRVKAKFVGFRNPIDAKKDTASKTIKVSGSDTKNLYLVSI
jgi:hypothetical protein